MPKQLRILILLFTAFIIIFVIIRRLLVPDSFGQFGHYRGDALIENENKEFVYAGTPACVDCHSDIYDLLLSDMHADLSCEVCHGPGLKHVDTMEPVDISRIKGRELCGRCHSLNPARPMDVIFQVDVSEHNIEFENCVDCHNPHQVWEINE